MMSDLRSHVCFCDVQSRIGCLVQMSDLRSEVFWNVQSEMRASYGSWPPILSVDFRDQLVLKSGEDPYDTLSLEIIFRKRAL